MPAILAHHLFGEDASVLLPEGMLANQQDLLAFLLGNQGVDPLWAHGLASPGVAHACHQLASRVHTERITDVLMSMRGAVSQLDEDERSIGRAFVLGIAAHYLLDSMAHPLICAQEEELAQADAELAACRDEVHAIIESDLDSWTLWETRHLTVLDAPSSRALARTSQVERIAGVIVSHMAKEIFGMELSASEFAKAVRDYQLLYKAIDPPALLSSRLLFFVERLGLKRSRLRAQAHVITTSDKCASANLEHRPWRNPTTGEISMASFPDLYHDALFAWPEFSRCLVVGDKERLDLMVGGIDYYGRAL